MPNNIMIKFDEFNNFDILFENISMSSQEIDDMDAICKLGHGIENIVIWIGPNKNYNKKIIKVSNVPNDYKGKDCFTILLPEFRIIGHINKNLITDDIIRKIKMFADKNLETINKYSNNEITSDVLCDELIKYNK